MTWEVSAEFEDFPEAVEWFLARIIIDERDRDALLFRAKSRAFWIAGVAQLDLVQQVFDAIDVALEAGVPLADFKKSVRTALASAWGKDNPHRIETIYRNAVQGSYNAGRYRQMRDVQRRRPFWLFDAIRDSRNSTICRTRDGTILPADDPWWLSNWPQLHHRCRSTVRALRESDARRRGVSERAPTVGVEDEPQRGFGTAPDDTLDVPANLRPDASRLDPGLAGAWDAKAAEAANRNYE